MKKKSDQKRIPLLNGCYVSKFTVFPANWNEPGADLSLEWRINYRFYDPAFKDHPTLKGVKQCKVMGMNSISTLEERRETVRQLLKVEKNMIIDRGYNPITKSFMKDELAEAEDYIIHPSTTFIQALREAQKRLKGKIAPSTNTDLTSVVNGIEKASLGLRMQDRSVSDIKRRHIIKMLDHCQTVIPGWSPKRRNKYRAYLMTLYKELVSIEAVEHNIIQDVPIVRGIIPPKREVLTEAQRRAVNEHLKVKNYPFWIFMQIFYHSGARETELLALKRKDVDLANQTFTVLIKKGDSYNYATKTIRNKAVQFWQQALFGANPEDYIFSIGLKPGPKNIRPDQITRRWKRHVKDELGITADFYSIKHSNTDDTDNAIFNQVREGLKVAAAQNSHTTVRMTEEVYAVNHGRRMHDILKEVGNEF